MIARLLRWLGVVVDNPLVIVVEAHYADAIERERGGLFVVPVRPAWPRVLLEDPGVEQ